MGFAQADKQHVPKTQPPRMNMIVVVLIMMVNYYD